MASGSDQHIELLQQFASLQEMLENKDATSAQTIAQEMLEIIQDWRERLDNENGEMQSKTEELLLERQELETSIGELKKQLANSEGQEDHLQTRIDALNREKEQKEEAMRRKKRKEEENRGDLGLAIGLWFIPVYGLIAGPIATAVYVEKEKVADTFKRDREVLRGKSRAILSRIKDLNWDLEKSEEEQQELYEDLTEEKASQEKNRLEGQFIARLHELVKKILSLVQEAENRADNVTDVLDHAAELRKVRESRWERIHLAVNEFQAHLEETALMVNKIESVQSQRQGIESVHNQEQEQPRSYLSSGDVLRNGQMVMSRNRRFTLCMQEDGNLVVYSRSTPIWASRDPIQEKELCLEFWLEIPFRVCYMCNLTICEHFLSVGNLKPKLK